MRPHAIRPALRRLALPALALALAAWASPAVRADNIDVGLVKNAPAVLKFLKDHNYKNVGVLRFQLQKGRRPATYAAGPINGNMATRLENALLLETDTANPVGIIHDASAVAAAKAPDKHFNENSAKDRAGLFENAYPLAWGDSKVKADAFLHGRVRFSDDMKTTTVQIACFDRKSEEQHKVCEIEVKTDRTVLADAGESYVLKRSLLKKRGSEIGKDGKDKDGNSLDDLFDKDAADSAKDRNDKKGASNNAAAVNDYLDFEVRYNDVPQQLIGDPTEGGELRIAAPRTGQSVMFALKNKQSDDIGVVIYVNGKSTLEYMIDPAEKCRRWIIPAGGETFGIRGYVDANDVLTPFRIVGPNDDLIKNELAEKLGMIEAVVFLKGQNGNANNANRNEMLVSRSLNLRKLSPYYQKKLGLKAKPETPAEARSLAYKSAGLRIPIKGRGPNDGIEGFIVPDPDLKEQLSLEQRDFPNPTPVATPIVIRYNDRSGN
jgi:hypothetical protein